MTNDNSASIEIRNLYKIFGKNPKAYVERVQKGMSKAEAAKQMALQRAASRTTSRSAIC